MLFFTFLSIKIFKLNKNFDATLMFGYNRFERYGSRYVSAFIKENAPFFYQKITDAYN